MSDVKNGIMVGLDDPRYRVKTSQQMAAACTGALITSFVVTPFDVVKIRLQSQQRDILTKKCFLYCNGLMDHVCPCYTDKVTPEQRPVHFNGTIDAFGKITRSEGLSSLWSGMGPTLVLAVPATIVYFVLYENLRLSIKDKYAGVQPTWGPLVSGAGARFVSVSLVSPLELIRTKMQSKRVTYWEIGQAIKDLLRVHGPRGLFKGLSSTLLRDVPFSAIYWMHYEYFKKKLGTDTTPNFAFSFLAGAAAGSIAAVATNPFDVVKTHQQIELGEKIFYAGRPRGDTWFRWLEQIGGSKACVTASFLINCSAVQPNKIGRSTASVMKEIIKSRGYSGLFTGLTPRLVKVAPACAIMISTFEYGKQFFSRATQLGVQPTLKYFLSGDWQEKPAETLSPECTPAIPPEPEPSTTSVVLPTTIPKDTPSGTK